jgi:hypothetical protein
MELKHQNCSRSVPSTCCLDLEHNAAEGFGTILSAKENALDMAVPLHSARVVGASAAYCTEEDLADRDHSSSRHSPVAARLDTTWLSCIHSRAP